MTQGDMQEDKDVLRIAVLVSGHGRGSNLQAILDACASGEIPGRVAVVIGTRADAPAMERARNAGVPTVTISPRRYAEDESGYAAALLNTLRAHDVRLICLAGYMRILPQPVVEAYRGKIMNVHPALLPLFGGKGMYGEHVHRAVLESGMKVSGCTVHFVDEHYDTGPIILQATVPVRDDDTPETLAARVLPEEHKTYVCAIRLFAEGRLRIEGKRVRILEGSECNG
ncbi:MAG TPA: phosphoribosylglycinamide formyltransferase [Chthonomonadales bacterium]|nr:phosphoribosylglycinamide formyltransferase [Chthonomonadales bacterium]